MSGIVRLRAKPPSPFVSGFHRQLNTGRKCEHPPSRFIVGGSLVEGEGWGEGGKKLYTIILEVI